MELFYSSFIRLCRSAYVRQFDHMTSNWSHFFPVMKAFVLWTKVIAHEMFKQMANVDWQLEEEEDDDNKKRLKNDQQISILIFYVESK